MRKAGCTKKTTKAMKTKITSLVALVLFFATILMSCDNELSPDIETIEAGKPQEPQKEVQHFHLGWDEDDYSSTYYSANVFNVKREYEYNDTNDWFSPSSNSHGYFDFKYLVRIATNIHPDGDYMYLHQ